MVYKEISEIAPIRQGDVIVSNGDGGVCTYGLIITADCDIAREKHKNHFTWVELVSVYEYISSIWAFEEVAKRKDKPIKVLLEYVNGKLKGQGYAEVSAKRLVDWIVEVGVELFVDRVLGGVCPPDIRNKMEAVHIACSNDPLSAIDRLRLFCDKTQVDFSGVLDRAKKDLTGGDGGFPDFFFLPKLPGALSGGAVALLRNIYSIQNQEIYVSESQARISNQSKCFYRVCRLEDRVKYSITQKIAFLFSRIGMSPEFECLASEAASLAIEFK
ncbi:hypothetical protein CK486_07370 [Pseudomonas sp. HAR-UPW-AIA-41]|uniref:hypothetical protein n=1 Tax=Pseudomonas sp. HAR-UPW-AIA-41 TaxID=1985301 RepID=UPI000BB2F240|nr:hypothetical protein [Pseudomonas sp. HAR-UPW-AIA-41]PAV48277.1 hypothetical protein CK486_07370 [Pseudomonas sp. HAR-UPW-AIA-41]